MEAELLNSYGASNESDDVMMQRLVLRQLQDRARERDLPGLETVEGVILSPLEEWSPANVSYLPTYTLPMERRLHV